jgi:hypothetical protein
LDEEATLDDYENIIRHVLHDGSAQVYVFWYEQVPYVTIVIMIDRSTWLVMFNLDGIMETAFVVKRPDKYLSAPDYEYIGRIDEVVQDEV